jgi:hypothetical protein
LRKGRAEARATAARVLDRYSPAENHACSRFAAPGAAPSRVQEDYVGLSPEAIPLSHKGVVMFRFPSPSLVVSMVALVVALGGAGYSATGGNFILGNSNTASTQTRLVAPFAGPSFRIDNASTAAGASGLSIVTNTARPPMVVNSSVRVVNLNADKLDGVDSTEFPRVNRFSFNLQPGKTSAEFPIPADRPVFIMGAVAAVGAGIGQITMLRETGGYTRFTGLESPSPSSITSGAIHFDSIGAHLVYVDAGHFVEIQTSANGIRVYNADTIPRAGPVTIMW